MQHLLLLFLASSAIALKSPTLCPNGKGNDFVCDVIAPVNNKDSYSEFSSITDVTIGKNGQSEFYTSSQSLEVLTSSLRNKTNAAALSTSTYSWFQTLGKVTVQLENAEIGTDNLVNSIASGLKKLQTSYEKTTTQNANKVEKVASKLIGELSQEIDQKAVRYIVEDYTAAVEKCKASVSKQVETQQNRTRQGVEKAYDSLIDLTDQIGLCLQNNDIQGKCARTVQTKSSAVNSLGRTAQVEAAKFEGLGNKSFEKDACLQNALKAFERSVVKILKTAQLKD